MKDLFKEHKFWFLIPITIIIVYGILLIGITWPISEFSISKAGQFGDSFGVLNSMFSGFAFISLVITIYLQQKEMMDTKQEMFNQNFENTFFKMLDLFNTVIKDLNFKCKEKTEYMPGLGNITIYFNKIGKETFKYDNNFNIKGKEVIYELLNLFLKYAKIIDKDHTRKVIGRYEDFHNEFESNIGHYFGTIYQILKFIDESSISNKERYSNLFRAQFSKLELEFLFYHSTSKKAESKFTPLLIKYEFLEHIDISHINDLAIKKILIITKKLNEDSNFNYSFNKIFGKNEKSEAKVQEVLEHFKNDFTNK